MTWVLVAFIGMIAWTGTQATPGARWEAHTRAGTDALNRGEYAEAQKKFATALEEAEALGPDPRLVASLANLAKTYVTLHKNRSIGIAPRARVEATTRPR